MSDRSVVVAEFETAGEAHLALNRLAAESIQGIVTNDEPNAGNFSLFGRMPYAPYVQVLVPESQAQRAREILAQRPKKMNKKWKNQAQEMDGWLCHLCDTFVEEDVSVCPACAEPRKRKS